MGDWIVGLSPKAKGNRVVYAMRVDEILPFERYYRDPRFADKIPDSNKGEAACEFGDNIYKPLICNPQRNDDFEQAKPSKHGPKDKDRDLSGKNVLISWNFHYFGAIGPELPEELKDLKVGIGYKCNFQDGVVKQFIKFIEKQPKGRISQPSIGRLKDKSLRPG